MKRNILLSIFSGLLLWLAWPPMHYTTIFLFFALVPMLAAMENIIKSTSAKKGKLLFATTFIGFFIWNTCCIFWVYNSLKSVGALIAIPISMIPYMLGPLLMSTACWLYYRLRLSAGRNWGLAGLICFWIGYEYLHQTWGLAFPWMTLGNGFAVSHQWVQWYEYTGVYGGTIWIWVLNILIFLIYQGLIEAQTKPVRLRLITAFVILLIAPIAFSLYRYYTYQEQFNPANIVVVQPNIDPYGKAGDISGMKQLNILTHLSDSLARPNTEFFIWPETAIGAEDAINEDHIHSNTYFTQVQQFLSKYKNGNVLTGAATYRIYENRATPTANAIPGTNEFADNYNTALNIENSAQVGIYHKSKLVPGAEALPFGEALSFMKPAFEHLGGATGSYAGQAKPSVLYSQSGIGVTPVICYESIWGEWVAQSVQQGSQFIAIITNDGWWENTSGKDQHLDYAKLRAIETRRWVCRSANTGISAFINAKGDIIKQTKWWVPTAIKQDINLNQELTFYVKNGDYLPKTGSFLSILGILFVCTKVRVRKKNKG